MNVSNALVVAFPLLAYVLGSMPFGLWLVKAWKGIDVRDVGSGNIGTTNVYRAAGKTAAGLVFALDVAKGALPVALGAAFGLPPVAVALTGLAAILGHSKSIFLKFTGGKSVATGIGTFLAIAPAAAGVALAVFGVVFAISRVVALGSIVAALSLPAGLWVLGASPVYTAYGAVAAVYVLIRHRANIERLLAGKENRL